MQAAALVSKLHRPCGWSVVAQRQVLWPSQLGEPALHITRLFVKLRGMKITLFGSGWQLVLLRIEIVICGRKLNELGQIKAV